MLWKGETDQQWYRRVKEQGEHVFAWFPTQMDDGTWVWLERYWRFLAGISWKHCSYRRALNREDAAPKPLPQPTKATSIVKKPDMRDTSIVASEKNGR
jgi:hypothetical protein